MIWTPALTFQGLVSNTAPGSKAPGTHPSTFSEGAFTHTHFFWVRPPERRPSFRGHHLQKALLDLPEWVSDSLGLLQPSAFLASEHVPYYEMASINEAVFPIRPRAPGGNGPTHIQRNPEALFVDCKLGHSPKSKAQPSIKCLLSVSPSPSSS